MVSQAPPLNRKRAFLLAAIFLVQAHEIAALVKFDAQSMYRKFLGPKPHLPDVVRLQHWWSNQDMLDSVLEEAEQRYATNLQLRNTHGQMKKFMDSGKGPGEGADTMYLDALMIPTYHCTSAYRLGSWVDGGHWLCLSHLRWTRTPFILSVGNTGDTGFEAAAFKFLGVGTYLADYSLPLEEAAAVRRKKYILGLHEVALVGSKDLAKMKKEHRNVNWVTVFNLMEIVGTQYVDIFKLDCEEICEYGVIADLASRYTRETVPFGQVLMEMHLPAMGLKQTTETFKIMESLGFRLFHSELNRFFDEPKLFHYEVSFIHERLVLPRKDGD